MLVTRVIFGVSMTIELDSDRALANDADDQFGFVGMAERLAPSILEASKGDGLVIGLEGPWGSGKTSLLNFLRSELEKGKDGNIHTVTIAPWLNGDSASLVSSLLGPISEVLTAKEEERAIAGGEKPEEIQIRIKEVSEILRGYGQKTARNIAPLASLAGYFLPGGQLVADGLNAGADALEHYAPQGTTPSELKELISEKIKALDIGFVIILDDLDRLEPEYAVEVVRLVRSVADFPNVAYLMCYDRDVLAQALKTGLKVKDGDLFLQKIVQLTFAIPLPEPFDLRAQFLNEAQLVFEKVTGSKPAGDLLDDLRSAVDLEGTGLRTPREVKLALNGIRFVYPSIADDVYFPDFCRLHLIKTTQFKLYKWLEVYLSLRSTIVTGDGSIMVDGKRQMGKSLKKLLPSDEIGASRSIWNLTQFIPGVTDADKPENRVFTSTERRTVGDAIGLKRLGSPLHYRYYFALTGPKAVMSDADFDKLLQLAQKDIPALKKSLINYMQPVRQSGKTWFEHILDRLDDEFISELDQASTVGLTLAICDIMDTALTTAAAPRAFSFGVDGAATSVVKALLTRLREINIDEFAQTSKQIAATAGALNWIVGSFFRDQMWNQGKAGDRPKPEDLWLFPDDMLEEILTILRDRLTDTEVRESLSTLPDLSKFLYAWRELSGEQTAKDWVTENSQSDEGFLSILNHLRHWSMSDKVFYPLSRESISHFFDLEATLVRLGELENGDFDDKVRELKQAIEQARN